MSRSVGRIKRGPMAADVLGMHFTQVFNKAARDKRLSRRARGLLLELLSHQDGFGVSIEGLVAQGPEGRDAIRAAIAELEKYGYLHRERERDPETGRLGDSVYSVTDMPDGVTLTAAAPWADEEPETPTEAPEREPASSGPTSEKPTLDSPTQAEATHKNTNLKKNNTTEDTAPSARSAGDVRRTTDRSDAREADSGCAATEETSPAADEIDEAPAVQEEAQAAGQPRKVPGPRSGSYKPSPFAPEIRQAIYRTENLLPEPLRAALLVQFPYGHLPNTTRQVTAQALETRTPEELGERAARRWISYGYERDHYDGLLRSPLGVVEELLRPTPYCPVADCEDGQDRHTRLQCTTCEQRIEQRKQDRKAGRKVRTARPTRLYRDREECDVCNRPLPQGAATGDLCRPCQTEMDEAFARALSGPTTPEIPQEAADGPEETPASEDTPETPDVPEEDAETRREREEMELLKARIAAENPGLAAIAKEANH